jgi:Tfp pilus assembly protein PilF
VNQLGYTRLQSGDNEEAVALFTLNVEAYPSSSNAQDSLADGYIARGENSLALAAARKCLELLPADRISEPAKAAIRRAAEEKISKLKK